MLELVLLCKFILAQQTEWNFECDKRDRYIYFYEGCAYEVHLWGANGGKGLDGGYAANGGIGAYVRGIIKLSKSQNMIIHVGEAGSDGWKWMGGAGGYNGGAKGGDDTGTDGDDAAGGGGGATDIGFTDGTRIASAAGGSGAACGVMGAPGGGINEHGDLTSDTNVIFGTEGGTGIRDGSAGLNHDYCPGSGGSGGWEGGKGGDWAYSRRYEAVGYSGSSGYLGEYLTHAVVKRGNDPYIPDKPGFSPNGYAKVRLINSDDVTCLIPRPSPTASQSLHPTISMSPWPTPTPVYTQRGDAKKAIKQKRGKIFEVVIRNSLYLVAL